MSKEKWVTIRQTKLFSILPEESRPEFVKKIGSKFDKNTGSVLIGLNEEECEYILPMVIRNNKDNDGLDWAGKVERWYAELSIEVPFSYSGKRLNIATINREIKDINHKLVIKDVPVKPLDYIIWKQCIKDPDVATTDHELKFKENQKYYLEDSNKEKEKTIKLTSEVNSLDKTYLNLIRDDKNGSLSKVDQINAVLRMLGKNPDQYDNEEKVAELSILRDDSKDSLKAGVPLKEVIFYTVVNDPDLALKAEIMIYVSNGFIQQEGSYYRDPNSDIQLGSNIQEAVNFFKDDNNSQYIQNLRFKIKGKPEIV